MELYLFSLLKENNAFVDVTVNKLPREDIHSVVTTTAENILSLGTRSSQKPIQPADDYLSRLSKRETEYNYGKYTKEKFTNVTKYYIEELLRSGRVHIPVAAYGDMTTIRQDQVTDFMKEIEAAISAYNSEHNLDIAVSVANQTGAGFDLVTGSKSAMESTNKAVERENARRAAEARFAEEMKRNMEARARQARARQEANRRVIAAARGGYADYQVRSFAAAAILPTTFDKINDLIYTGSATTLSILKMMVKQMRRY